MAQFDDPWLEALRGSQGSGSSQDREEANAVRSYLQKREHDDRGDGPDAQVEKRMLAYLRRNGVLTEPASGSASRAARMPAMESVRRFLGSIAGARPYYALAGVLAVGLGIGLIVNWQAGNEESPTESPIYRGGVPLVDVVSAEPEVAAAAITAVLGKHGIPNRVVHENGNRIRIEAKVPAGERDAVAAELRAWKISVPQNGIVVVAVHP